MYHSSDSIVTRIRYPYFIAEIFHDVRVFDGVSLLILSGCFSIVLSMVVTTLVWTVGVLTGDLLGSAYSN